MSHMPSAHKFHGGTCGGMVYVSRGQDASETVGTSLQVPRMLAKGCDERANVTRYFFVFVVCVCVCVRVCLFFMCRSLIFYALTWDGHGN